MSFGFGISDFEYVFNVLFRLRNFVKSIKDAPKDFDALRAEANCLNVCLKVLGYKECRRILRQVSRAQAQDLRLIVNGCKLNMKELIGFVTKCQIIAADSGGKPKWKSLSSWIFEQGKKLWNKIVFAWKEKQPMREKLAIPVQSLNIYLVSLTYECLSYTNRFSYVPPKWQEDWVIMGQKVAFKDRIFAPHLLRSATEDKIVKCAILIANGTTCWDDCSKGWETKEKEKDHGGSPNPPRRKPSRTVSGSTSDRMYLVRPKSRARSKSPARGSVEIRQTGRDLRSDSGSDSGHFDESDIPRYTTVPAPPAIFVEEAPRTYEDPSPRRETSAPHESFEQRPDPAAYEHREDEAEGDGELRAAERRGCAQARSEIKRDRKRAVSQLSQAMDKMAEEQHRASLEAERAEDAGGEPDIRIYIEVTYGVIIDLAPPEVQRMNAIQAHLSSVEPTEFDVTDRSDWGAGVVDSDVSSDPDSESEPIAGLLPVSGYGPQRPRRARPLFSIPRSPYTPRTEGFEDYGDFLSQRDRERSLRNREASMREREASLRERELALTARERRMREDSREDQEQDRWERDSFTRRAPVREPAVNNVLNVVQEPEDQRFFAANRPPHGLPRSFVLRSDTPEGGQEPLRRPPRRRPSPSSRHDTSFFTRSDDAIVPREEREGPRRHRDVRREWINFSDDNDETEYRPS